MALDLLAAMRVFATVVEAGSFAAAADKLEMSRAMVTRHVAQLESHLGVRLLHRTTRRLSLTEAGAGYHQRARFYAISEEGKLRYAKLVAEYLCFLAETTGMATPETCTRAKNKLASYERYDDLLSAIAGD